MTTPSAPEPAQPDDCLAATIAKDAAARKTTSKAHASQQWSSCRSCSQPAEHGG